MSEQNQHFVPHQMESGRYFCSRAEFGINIDDLLAFLDENPSTVIFIIDEGKPTLVLIHADKYKKMRDQERRAIEQISGQTVNNEVEGDA